MAQLLDLLNIFVNNIVPILTIAGIGFLVGRRFGIEPKPIGTLIFNVLSPALVFWLFYNSDVDGGEFLALFAGTVMFQVTMAVGAFGAATIQGVTPVHRANLMIAAFCLNAGNFGLSLIDFAFGAEVLSRAVVVLIANVTTNYSLGVYLASNGRASPRQALFNVARTPAIYALLAAFILRGIQVGVPLPLGDTVLTGYPGIDQSVTVLLPLPIARAVERLADAAIPMMLIMLGLQMGRFTRLTNLRLVTTGVSLKLLVAPLVALGVGTLLGLERLALTALVMQASMPTAVLTLIFANQFDLDNELQLNLIMGATLLSPFTLSVLILIFQS